ncbi:hypothetical protein BH11CYA1_BH11CYA1_17470 [soil metagenome]
MRPVIKACFALFTAVVSAPLAGQLLLQPALAVEGLAASAKAKGAHEFSGMADYYHHSLYGKKTASGQVLAKHLFTAAHRTLPFGTHVHVKNHSNGRSCIVVINDRGPFTKSKVIDLSHSAATELDMISAGTCKVGCTVVAAPKGKFPIAKAEPVVTAEIAALVETAAKNKPQVATKKPDAVTVKAQVVEAKPELIAVKSAKEKPIIAGAEQITQAVESRPSESRADESSAELEGAVPIKWTEVQ